MVGHGDGTEIGRSPERFARNVCIRMPVHAAALPITLAPYGAGAAMVLQRDGANLLPNSSRSLRSHR